VSILINDDRTRMITDESGLFAVAGYEGEVRDDRFVGRHAGCFHTMEDGEAWLKGEGSPTFVVYSEIDSK